MITSQRLHLSGSGSSDLPPLANFSQQSQGSSINPEQIVAGLQLGVVSNPGGRAYNEDRYTAFSVHLKDGRRFTVGAVLDGHHQFHVAQMVCESLPLAFIDAAEQFHELKDVLAATVRSLDELAFQGFHSARFSTGGTTLILHVITGNQIYTANVGDCKGILSSKGAPEPLSEAHNPPVETERRRFSDAGVSCYADHVGGSDINVCRTIGDWDLGAPLKWRGEDGHQLGPLISEPEITVHGIEAIDEFIVTATDGLWDYYTPESSVVTDARRALRAADNDPQQCAEWLLKETLTRQRATLHAGTPGDNITILVIQLRPLPSIPRASTSRLNLSLMRRGSGEDANGLGVFSQHSLSESEGYL